MMKSQEVTLYIFRQSKNKRYTDDYVIASQPINDLSLLQRLNFDNLSESVNVENMVVRLQTVIMYSQTKIEIKETISEEHFDHDNTVSFSVSAKNNNALSLIRIIAKLGGCSLTESRKIIEEIGDSGNHHISTNFGKLITFYTEDKGNHPIQIEIGQGKLNYSANVSVDDDDFVNGFYIPRELKPILEFIAPKVFETKGHFTLWAAGPSGYGKTSLFQAIAERYDKKLVYVNCPVMLNPEQWFGRTRAKDGETYFDLSEFAQAVIEGNCVIVLDETNRTHPTISNSLFPLLDHRRETIVNGEVIKSGGGIIFGFTTNLGMQYTGTSTLDVAFRNRAQIRINVGRLPESVEKEIIKRAVPDANENDIDYTLKVCNEIRNLIEEEAENDNFLDIDVSTRTSKNMVELLTYGVDKDDILNYTVFNMLDSQNQTIIRDKVNLL